MQDTLNSITNKTLLSNHTPSIKEAEIQLTNLYTSLPNQTILNIIHLLKSTFHLIAHQNIDFRTFYATQLRKSLSKFTQSSYSNLWEKLTPENQAVVKNEIFEALAAQKEYSVQKIIADMIGQVAGSLLCQQKQNKWPQFLDILSKVFQINNVNIVKCGFIILQTILSYASHIFKPRLPQMYALFKGFLEHQDLKLRIQVMKSTVAYILILDRKQSQQLEVFCPLFFSITLQSLKIEQDEPLLALNQIADMEPKFLRKSFEGMKVLLNSINSLQIEYQYKATSIQLLLTFIQAIPSFFRKNPEHLKYAFQMIFLQMIQISNTIRPQWIRPPEGFTEEDQDQDYNITQTGMQNIDRIIESVGQSECLGIVPGIIARMLENTQDWRYTYSAIMALSQVGQYIEKIEDISPIINNITKYLHHQNPMLRFSVCHAVGQISDDMQPHFQNTFTHSLIPILIHLLKDPVPRVVAHSASALTNFIEGMSQDQISNYINEFVTCFVSLIQGDNMSLIKQAAMNALSSVAEAGKELIIPFVDHIVPLLFKIFTIYTTKQYKQLKGHTLECIVLIAQSSGRENYNKYLPDTVRLLIQIQNSQLAEIDPQKTYVLSGWQRLSLNFKQQLTNELPNILPGLFNLVQAVLSQKQQVIENGQNQKVNTYETQQAQIAIQMLKTFIQQLGASLPIEYIQKITSLLYPIIKDHENDDLRKQSCKVLPKIIQTYKSQFNIASHYLKKFISVVIQAAQSQFESQIIIQQLEALKQCINIFDTMFLNELEVNQLSQKIIKLLTESGNRKKQTEVIAKEEELQDDQKQCADLDVKLQQQLHCSIANFIGSLFKTHKQMCKGLVSFILQKIFPSLFQDRMGYMMHKFGIFLIDDFVQHLGYQLLGGYWKQFAEVLVKYSLHNVCDVRQASNYGIGIFAVNTPTQNFTDYLPIFLDKLLAALHIKKGPEKQKVFLSCQNNTVASLGKIFKFHGNTVTLLNKQGKLPKQLKEYLQIWLQYLPLKIDKAQGHSQLQFLTQIMQKDSKVLVCGNETKICIKIVHIYTQVFQTKYSTDSINKQIKNQLKLIINDPIFIAHSQEIQQSMTSAQIQKLQNILKS